MGFSAQVQSPQTSGGKTGPMASAASSVANSQPDNTPDVGSPSFGAPQGKGASGQRFTYSPTSGQPAMGSPNQYTNTIGRWDNASIQQPTRQQSGKGKGV